MKPRTLIPMTAPLDEADAPPLRRFVWLKRIGIAVILLAVLIGVLYLWMVRREERRLAQELERWRAAGLPMTAEELNSPPWPQAMLEVYAAARGVDDQLLHAGNNYYEIGADDWSEHALQVVGKLLTDNRKALDALRKARLRGLDRNKPPASQGGPAAREATPPLAWSPLLNLAIMARIDARAHHLRGDDDGFMQSMADIRFVGRAATSESFLAILSQNEALMTILRDGHLLWAHSTPDSSSRELARGLIDEWIERPDIVSDQIHRLEMEAVDIIEWSRRTEKGAPRFMTPEGVRRPAAWENFIWRMMRPLRLRAAAVELGRYQQDIAAAKLTNWPAAKRGLSRAALATFPMGAEPFDTLLDSVIPMPVDHRSVLSNGFRRRLQFDIAAIVLAGRLYEIDHGGRDPGSLQELVPAYLTVVPRDPFDAKELPLRYVGATARPFVYSLGESGTDAIASGRYSPIPTGYSYIDWRAPNFVGFLDPSLPPVPVTPASTQSAPK